MKKLHKLSVKGSGWYSVISYNKFIIISVVYYSFMKYVSLKDSPVETGPIAFSLDVNYYGSLYQTWLIIGKHFRRVPV